MGDLAQQLLIFGTHVHIGIEDREFLIDAMNVSRYLLPHMLCLSTSSPFWIGRNTGLKSYRSVGVPRLPAHRHPAAASRRGPSSSSYVETLIDDRLHPERLEDLVGRAAALQVPDARVPHLRRVHARGRGGLHRRDLAGARRQAVEAAPRQHDVPRLLRRELIEENKWRAVRYGLDGKLIDFGKRAASSRRRELIREFIEWFLGDVVDELGTRKEVEYAYRILEEGTSADRQLATYERTGDLKAVVDQLIAETEEGVLTAEPAVSGPIPAKGMGYIQASGTDPVTGGPCRRCSRQGPRHGVTEQGAARRFQIASRARPTWDRE